MPESVISLQVVPPPRYFRFGPFELDARTGELRKHGIRIRVKHQAFEILLILVKHPGEVVLREEIRQKLWPHDTVVEFDHSINASIQKLRDALGESAGSPGYIETLPRRGYRFTGTVETVPAEAVSRPELLPDPEKLETATAPGELTGDRTLGAGKSHVLWRPWFLLGSALAVLLGALALARLPSPWTTRGRLNNVVLALGEVGSARVSPDGSAVIYSNSRGLVLRRLDSLDEIPIYSGDRLVDAFTWSPDSSQILFRTFQGLIRLPLPYGPPSILWPKLPNTRGFAWAPDGTVLSARLGRPEGGELFQLPASGGEPTRLDVPGLTRGRFYYPEFLPDGKNFLFAWESWGDLEAGLYLATLSNGKLSRGPILLRKNLTAGHYSAAGGGNLLYVQNDKLYAQKLNIAKARLEGKPERVVDGVFTEVNGRRAHFSVSRNGVLVWQAGRTALAQLTWFDRAGAVLGTAGPLCLASDLKLSPDEKYVLIYTLADGTGFSLVQSNQSGHVGLPGLIHPPIWMPDSSHILYFRREDGTSRVMERAAAGGPAKELVRVPTLNTLHDVSADGKVLLYKVGPTLYSIRLDEPQGAAKPQVVAETTQGRFSPDGRWVVYSKETASHRPEIYVQPFPEGGLPTQLTSTGGIAPLWRADGKEIFYRKDSAIYSLRVEVKAGTIHFRPPEALFNVRVPDDLYGDSMPMAVTADGSRILFAQGVEQPNPRLTYVMTAWDRVLHR